MLGRSVTLLLLAVGCSIPCLAWGDPPCEDAITYRTYLGKGKNIRGYELIPSGNDADKYKPVFFVEVMIPGPCKGKYANPCGYVASDNRTKSQVSPETCKELVALHQQRTLDARRALTVDEYDRLETRDKTKYVRITEGPDAYKGAYKPKYYARLDRPPEMPKAEAQASATATTLGYYAPPNNHFDRDTVVVDPWLAKRLGQLVRRAK